MAGAMSRANGDNAVFQSQSRQQFGDGALLVRFRRRLVVTHEMSFAREVSTQVVFMNAGEIVEAGSSVTFFANPRQARTQAFLGPLR